ncbi:MAG TPA: hypothetical protein ENI87_06295 [bacterium]|nr:hypothetical protein [bacterium]
MLPLVVTVQTDGATNFDLPVPIEFPNLPDPITGRPLAPGAKTALWSFDHDLGRFRIMGSMTVTADGSRVVSDPGVGLRAPGWHGWGLGNLLAALDITDCTQGNCNAQTNCVLLKDFLGVTKEIYGCISPVGRVAQVIGCGAAILNDTASAQASYNEFLSAWSNRSATAPVREWLDASFGIVQELRTTFGCLTEGFKPGDFDCAAATYSSIELFCTAGGLGSATPQGCPSNAGAAPQWVENVCDGIPVVSSTLAIGSSIYGFYEHPPDFSELGDRIDTILDSYGIVDEVLNIAEVLERPLTPTETRQIEATLAAIDTAFDDVDAALEGAGDAYDELNEALDSYQAMLDEVEQQVATLGQPVTGRFHYRAETRRNSLAAEAGTSPPNVVRGTTTENATVELNMNAESGYRVDFYDPIRGLLATSIGRTGGQGGRTEAATAIVIPAAELADTDGDGLPDDAEPIFGTDPTLPDTDGDTVSDLDEVLAGSDPTGNALAGVIARVSTDGAAIDVCVDNGLAAVITANDRLQVFNVFAGAAPSLLTTVALPGTPRDVACAGGFVLVALGSDGAVVVDPTASPPLVRPVLGLCASATSAAAADGSGYLGLDGSGLAIIDLASQTVVAVRDFPGGGEIRAISIAGRYAYAVTTRRLFAVDLLGDGTYPLVFDQYAQAAGFPVQSVFAGLDTLFVVHVAGFDRYSLTDPANPQLVDIGVTTRRGWKNMVTDGGQLAIAASADDSPLNSGRHDVARYDLSLPGNVWLGDIQTDGVARAVQLDAGIVFVADDANGLVVVRPFDADQANEAPMLTLETGFDPGTALPSGATALVRARASDNGLVQQVAFYLDDLLVAIDTSFPFEHRYRELPGGTDGAEHTLRVRATDTAGISTEQQLAVYVQPDTAGPTVIASTPATGGIAPPGSVVALSLRFDEPIDPVSLGSAGLVLLEAGPDGLRETGDDVPFALTAPQLDQQRFELSTASTVALPNGRFRLIAPAGGLRDDAGNGIDRTAIDFDAVAGLRVQFFAETDCHSRRSFFAGRDPVAFERYLPGRPVEVVAETVVSNIDFVLAPTPWLWSRGPDGVLQSSQVATPLGDDYALHALAGTRLGVRFEGYLHVPETGAVTFSANIDDDLTLAVDDVIVLDGVCCGLTTGDPIVLEAGVHRIRAGFVDYGGSAILQLYAEGAGLPGGVLPPAAFGF